MIKETFKSISAFIRYIQKTESAETVKRIKSSLRKLAKKKYDIRTENRNN